MDRRNNWPLIALIFPLATLAAICFIAATVIISEKAAGQGVVVKSMEYELVSRPTIAPHISASMMRHLPHDWSLMRTGVGTHKFACQLMGKHGDLRVTVSVLMDARTGDMVRASLAFSHPDLAAIKPMTKTSVKMVNYSGSKMFEAERLGDEISVPTVRIIYHNASDVLRVSDYINRPNGFDLTIHSPTNTAVYRKHVPTAGIEEALTALNDCALSQ